VHLTCDVRVVPTPVGPARVHLSRPRGAAGLLALGHGAGAGVDGLDLLAARDAGHARGLSVALVEQPWRVAGRRVAEAPPRLDAAWTAVLAALGPQEPLVVGGRSAGARVACRTARDVGAAAVLALAFPLVAPSGRSRAAELAAPAVPRLVVQGSRDAFGVPDAAKGLAVHVVAGADHAFSVRRRDGRTPPDVADEVREQVRAWLARTLPQTLT
jgi:uncharacterized protein